MKSYVVKKRQGNTSKVDRVIVGTRKLAEEWAEAKTDQSLHHATWWVDGPFPPLAGPTAHVVIRSPTNLKVIGVYSDHKSALKAAYNQGDGHYSYDASIVHVDAYSK